MMRECMATVTYGCNTIWEVTAQFPTLLNYLHAPYETLSPFSEERNLMCKILDVEQMRVVPVNPDEPIIAACLGPGLFVFTDLWLDMSLEQRKHCVLHEATHQISGEGYHTGDFYKVLTPLLNEFDISLETAEFIDPTWYNFGPGRYEVKRKHNFRSPVWTTVETDIRDLNAHFKDYVHAS